LNLSHKRGESQETESKNLGNRPEEREGVEEPIRARRKEKEKSTKKKEKNRERPKI